jgi:hypothetical protein
MAVCGHKGGWCLTAILVSLALAVPVSAQQYSFRYYGTEDGLTNLAAKVLFQDRAGFLWAATESGVFRFDGQRFQRYGPAEGLPREVILSLGEAPDGSVLAGCATGLYQLREGCFEKLALPGAGHVDGYSSIRFDGKGQTFIATDRGVIVATARGQGGIRPFAFCRLRPAQAVLMRMASFLKRAACGTVAAAVCVE